jgi:hypothetical protein
MAGLTSTGVTYLFVTFEDKLACVPKAPESCTGPREGAVIGDADPW